ncbi:MAG: hypothetical protein ACK5PD_04940 [Pirellulaceae bacterium]
MNRRAEVGAILQLPARWGVGSVLGSLSDLGIDYDRTGSHIEPN